jgi:hypothetical protein
MAISDSELPNFGDKYLQYFNPERQKFELRRKSTNEGCLGISEAMELLGRLMKKHQLSFIPNTSDKTLLLLPFAFIEPEEGDRLLNTSTKEMYTVEQIIRNPDTNQWNGVVKLDLVNQPSIEERHSLRYLNSDRYLKFDHEYPDSLVNIPRANLEGQLQNLPPIVPTIAWSLQVVEPGGLGKPFDSRKELKPRLRESTKDPYVSGYTVEIWGQFFDNIVQFDAYSSGFKQSERLLSWMEQFVKLYTGFLRQKGISNIFFWRRNQEQQTSAWRQALPIKTTQFYFRTEEIEAIYQRDILKMDITLGVSETDTEYNDGLKYIASQKVSGNYTSQEYRELFYRSGEYLFGDLDIRQ